jgi:hypothetical protein
MRGGEARLTEACKATLAGLASDTTSNLGSLHSQSVQIRGIPEELRNLQAQERKPNAERESLLGG